YRIRVGNYRVIYHFEKSEIQILILKISHRKNVYLNN
ncbi:MAG: type II toxin-antitoxin system mRNA interferase toxin, RelE/StbE family, partial [Actinobacteria bacterium]|nr:type II toxin-antitoxin system mRNA interferase toxin, RelE/StbE family [Actinomycetota bacterium]